MKKPSVYLITVMIFVFAAQSSAEEQIETETTGLVYQDLKIGTGETAELGKVAVIHFSSWIDVNGKKGDLIFNSRENDNPVAFRIGTDMVIEGWNIGVVGMRVGGSRRLMVPPHLGYGDKGSGNVIPPNADLIYDIELIEVR